MDYYSPSKHDFGEINLYFKMIDKQFRHGCLLILTQNYGKDNGIFQVSHKIYCSWAIISDLRQIFILKSQSRFIQWNYKIWGKETANICETFRQFFSAEFGHDKMTKGKNIFSFEKALCFFHVETHSGKNVQQCMQNLN